MGRVRSPPCGKLGMVLGWDELVTGWAQWEALLASGTAREDEEGTEFSLLLLGRVSEAGGAPARAFGPRGLAEPVSGGEESV